MSDKNKKEVTKEEEQKKASMEHKLEKYKWKEQDPKKQNFMWGVKAYHKDNIGDGILEALYKIHPRKIHKLFTGFPEPKEEKKTN